LFFFLKRTTKNFPNFCQKTFQTFAKKTFQTFAKKKLPNFCQKLLKIQTFAVDFLKSTL